ncbi:hypothetical protein COJ85_22470 [Bacillus sp. AFS076308]|uniref:hypothetical protein n=1 Tax=unclassified Bacillus (in: firmicutes) TaxID=185979 RepID=UPI000BF6D84E|nr:MULTISPECIES: hypothetical protein [unclassified Bacillus (in: firmicutes)]PFN97800.1 hypothetical protein COJ85_22470 [Bacillus sp. AFS076308]PGV51136.1 hypothetical protein COD92_15275 [Bacillus sp. AFS037270]
MTRLELYHQHKTKQFSWKGLFFFIVVSWILTVSFFVFSYYYQNSIKIEEPQEKLGEKVVIQMPNGQKIYTYDNFVVEKDGKTFYKGERNTIDLTGGTVSYEDWK